MTLSNGTHTLEIISEDGSATCGFEVDIKRYYLSGTWVWNDEMELVIDEIYTQNINFTSFGEQYAINESKITPNGKINNNYGIHYSNQSTLVGSSGITVSGIGMTNPVSIKNLTEYLWLDEGYKTIDFGTEQQEVSKEFYEWFTVNANNSSV